MFNYLEKKSEKRIFYSYLHRFGLTWEDLNPRVSRLILNAIYDQAQATSHKFGEPLATVSGNIISAAAWGTIYCLMGSDQMLKMEPGYRDIVDEVEWELMISCEKEDAGSNIYCRVFAILYENGHCHPNVSTLLKACMHQAPNAQSFETGNCSAL